MDIQALIIEQLTNEIEDYFSQHLNQKLSKKRQKGYVQWIKSFLADDEKYYKSISFKGDVLGKFICASIEKELGEDFIVVSNFNFASTPSESIIREEIKSIREFFPKVKRLSFCLKYKDKKIVGLLKKMNFKVSSWEYIGSVENGLTYLEKNKDTHPIRPMSYKKDIKRVMEIEVIAHKKDKSSRIKSHSPKKINEMKKHYKKMCETKSAFVVENKKNVIGAIGTYPNKTLALLGTIVVDPKHQGKGVAKSLYKAALNDLKTRKSKYYKGYTTTDKVFSLGKKMKRKPSFVFCDKTF